MTEQPRFGVLLARLSQHREIDIGGLSRASKVPEGDLQAIFDGATPSSSLLGRIARAFGLHSEDLLVMAGLAVPADLAPLDATARSIIDELVTRAIRLNAERIRRLRHYAQSLPQQDSSRSVSSVPTHEQYEPNVGAMIVAMLRNRNLDWSSSARILFRLTGVGPLSASTIGAIGHGRKELSPELLAGFATILAIPVDDLAVMIGFGSSDAFPPVNSTATDVAELIWDIRRLTANQVRQVRDLASRVE